MSDLQVQIPFAMGPNETIDPRQAPPGTLTTVSNANYDADGQIQARLGYTQIAAYDYAANFGIKKLATFGTQVVSVDDLNVLTYSPQSGALAFLDAHAPYACTRAPLSASTSQFASVNQAVGDGYRVVAWIDQAALTLFACIYDAANGATVFPTVQLVTSGTQLASVYVAVMGTTAIVTCYATAAGPTSSIQAWTMNLSVLNSWSASTTISDANFTGTTSYGFCVLDGASASTFVIGYEKFVSPTQSDLILRSFNSSLVNQVTTTTALTAHYTGLDACALRGTMAENLWIAASWTLNPSSLVSSATFLRADPTTLVVSVNVTPIVTFSATSLTLSISVERVSSTVAVVAGTLPAATNQGFFCQPITTSGWTGSTTFAPNVGLTSALKWDPTRSLLLAIVSYAALNNNAGGVGTAGNPTGWAYPAPCTYYVVSVPIDGAGEACGLIATIAPGIGSLISQNNQIVPSFMDINGTSLEAVLPVTRNGAVAGLELLTIAQTANFVQSPATLGKELYLSGSYLDGYKLCETGFAYPPQIISATPSGSGDFTGNAVYCATFLRVDGAGNVEESAPSLPFYGATASSAIEYTVKVACLNLTNKDIAGNPAQVFVQLYRQPGIDSAAGNPLFYRCTPAIPASGQTNNQTAATISIVDQALDSAILVNPVLYTMSGELPHQIPETATHICSHVDRIWAIGADQRSIWFSQAYSDGVLPAWSADAILTVPDANEPLIALGSLYDHLAIFTTTRIYVVYGYGPSDTGSGNDLTVPQQVPGASGCIDPRSLVNTPLGLMYQSAKGIELLGADNSISFIGMPVSTTTRTYPVCTSATLCQDSDTVRFSFSNAAGTVGRLVIYDLKRQRWTIHDMANGASGTNGTGAAIIAACKHPTLGYVAAWNLAGGNNTTIARENTTADATPWLDLATYFIPLSVTMAPVKSGELQGWQRIRRVRVLANYYDAHGLSASFSYDYQGVNDTHAFTSAVIAANVNGSYEQVRYIPQYGRCEAIGVTLTTTAPTSPQVLGSGRGAGFSGIALEIHQKKGGYRPIATGMRS
jgi:hypothetical protein